MMKYERLTKSYKGAPLHTDMEVTDGDEIYERLAELEDDLESGKIIRLPCKVGADVWGIILQRDNFTDEPYKKVARATFRLSMLNDIGKTVFLTREEAEKKLKELQE